MPFVTLALATQQQSGVGTCSTGIESELAFACDFAIPFALAELSDWLITPVSFEQIGRAHV